MKIFVEKGTINGEKVENITVDVSVKEKPMKQLVCNHVHPTRGFAVGEEKANGERTCDLCNKSFHLYEPNEITKAEVEEAVTKAKKSLAQIRNIIHSELMYTAFGGTKWESPKRKYHKIDAFMNSLTHLPEDWEKASKHVTEMVSNSKPKAPSMMNYWQPQMQNSVPAYPTIPVMENLLKP